MPACEATGTYGAALATYLHERGHTVSIVNPAASKAYAQSHLSRTKNDRLDAGLVPRERRSGNSVRVRDWLWKIGEARVRKALYFPAVTALRCSSFFQE